MKPWHLLVAALALIAMIVLGTLGYSAFLAPVPPTVTPTPVPAQSLPISAEGRVVPARHAALGFEFAGRIKRVPVGQGDPVQPGDLLASLESDRLQTQVEGARAALAAARAEQDMLPEFASDEQEQLAQAQVEQAAAALEAAQLQLDHAELRAPFAGTVISLQAETGEVLAAGTPIVVLADTSRWYVETLDVLEEDAVRLRAGQPATVELAAHPDRELAGRVDRIALDASTYRGNVTYTVRISLPADPGLELSWGMTAFVDIEPAAETTSGLTPAPSLTPSPTSAATATATAAVTATRTVVPTSTRTSTPAVKEQIHVVAEGENLFRISLRYGVSVEAIREANDLENNLIYVGQRLLIPGPD